MRSGYNDDCDTWALICYRGAVNSAIKGRRGQAFLREMLMALDALPEPRLIENEFAAHGEVCALGAVGRARNLDMARLSDDESDGVASVFGIAESMVREIEFINDDEFRMLASRETPEHRFARVRKWVVEQITEESGE